MKTTKDIIKDLFTCPHCGEDMKLAYKSIHATGCGKEVEEKHQLVFQCPVCYDKVKVIAIVDPVTFDKY